MQLIKKMFGRAPAGGPGAESAQFHESEPTADAGSRNAPRRELIHVVLRDSMRLHGIPTAWIDCRVLSVVSRRHKTGLHVQLIVRDGVDRLLTYVPAFQRSFMEEIVRFDPRVDEWLLSISWQFHNLGAKVPTVMPDPVTWAPSVPAALTAGDAGRVPAAAERPAIDAPAPMAAQPAVAALSPAQRTVGPAGATPVEDEGVLEDLQALYAIRDAAMRKGSPAVREQKDFESTHPGDDEASGDPAPPRTS